MPDNPDEQIAKLTYTINIVLICCNVCTNRPAESLINRNGMTIKVWNTIKLAKNYLMCTYIR